MMIVDGNGKSQSINLRGKNRGLIGQAGKYIEAEIPASSTGPFK